MPVQEENHGEDSPSQDVNSVPSLTIKTGGTRWRKPYMSTADSPGSFESDLVVPPNFGGTGLF